MITSKWQFKIIIKEISFPLIVTLTSFIPWLNDHFLFIHGGPGYFLLLLCFPWVIAVLIRGIVKQTGIDTKERLISGIGILTIYIFLTFLFAYLFTIGMITMEVKTNMNEAIKFYFFPFSLLFH